jgi:hypothetical protein
MTARTNKGENDGDVFFSNRPKPDAHISESRYGAPGTRRCLGSFVRWDDHRLDAAAVGRYELCGEALVQCHIHRGHGGVAGPGEVFRVGHLEVDVAFRGHSLAGACGVDREAWAGLDFVGDGALRSGSAFVGGGEVVTERGAGGEAGVAGDGRCVVHADGRLP